MKHRTASILFLLAALLTAGCAAPYDWSVENLRDRVVVANAPPPPPPPPPIDSPIKVASFHNAAATADTGITGGFTTTEGRSIEAVVIQAQISSVSSIIYLTCTDGRVATRLLLNGEDSTPALDVGELYTFTVAITDRKQNGAKQALTWDVEFEESTTMDVVTIHKAQVP